MFQPVRIMSFDVDSEERKINPSFVQKNFDLLYEEFLSLFAQLSSLQSSIESSDSLTGITLPIKTVTTAYTISINDHTILSDCTSAAFTVTLPPAATAKNYIFNVKKIDSTTNNLTLDGNGSELIDGSLTKIITAINVSLSVHSDGSAWYII